MIRPLAALLFVMLAGCAAEKPVARKNPVPVPSGAAKESWKTNILPTEGITVEMPGDAEEKATATQIIQDKLFFHGLSLAPAGANLRFVAGAYSISTPNDFLEAEDVLEHLRTTFADITNERKVKIGALDAIAFEGKTDTDARFALRAHLVGATAYVLRVEATSGEVDERAAARFFDSFRLETPFRIFASPDDHFTIARPETALFKSFSERSQDPGAITKTYVFLYQKGDGFSMAIAPLAESFRDPALADDVAENIVLDVGKKEGNVIEQMRTIAIDGATGRDATVATENGQFTRLVVAVKEGKVFIASRFSFVRANMTDRDAELFFGSLTLGRAR
jgi:hypothetical protein